MNNVDRNDPTINGEHSIQYNSVEALYEQVNTRIAQAGPPMEDNGKIRYYYCSIALPGKLEQETYLVVSVAFNNNRGGWDQSPYLYDKTNRQVIGDNTSLGILFTTIQKYVLDEF